MTLSIDPAKTPARAHRYYACVRCGEINDEYETFGAGRHGRERYYCLRDIPLRARLMVWWNERVRSRWQT